MKATGGKPCVSSLLFFLVVSGSYCMRDPIQKLFLYFIVLPALVLAASVCTAGEFKNFLSLEGYTGLLNAPNAEVTDEGKVALLYSDQKEKTFRDLTREDSYIFSFGLLPYFELGGRLTDLPDDRRDLSANFKIKMPFIPEDSYLPDIAFGMQDLGGGAKNFQTKYLVASKEWWRLRFTLGYGFGPDRLDGTFGGLEVKAFDWLYLLGENDAAETNVGVRLVTPEIGGWPVSLQATAKTSLDNQTDHWEFGIGLQFPLGLDRHSQRPLPEKAAATEAGKTAGQTGAIKLSQTFKHPATKTSVPDKVEESKASLLTLRERLISGGFQNVQVGTDPEAAILAVEYENSRYNHNELDGLGVVIGIVTDTVSPDFEILQLIVRVKGIRMLQLTAPLADFREFLKDPEKEGQLDATLEITPYESVDKTVSFLPGSGNPSWLKSELILYPALSTLVGTDFSNFDYLLSLKPDLYVNAWKGAVLNARWDVPLDWTQVFDTGQPFDRRKASQFERLMLFQALKVTPSLMLNLGAGYVLHDTYGTLNELMWTPGSGKHRFEFKQVYLSNTESVVDEKKNVYLGSYRYYFSPLDLYVIGTAGRFLDQDRGYRLELKRFFGDTAVDVYFKDSKTKDDEHVQMGGVQISIPLTPRRDMKPRILQVKGDKDWGYSTETKIVAPGEANLLATSIGVNPTPLYNLERVFYNRDRLTEDYIRKHLLRLRDAYLTYGQ